MKSQEAGSAKNSWQNLATISNGQMAKFWSRFNLLKDQTNLPLFILLFNATSVKLTQRKLDGVAKQGFKPDTPLKLSQADLSEYSLYFNGLKPSPDKLPQTKVENQQRKVERQQTQDEIAQAKVSELMKVAKRLNPVQPEPLKQTQKTDNQKTENTQNNHKHKIEQHPGAQAVIKQAKASNSSRNLETERKAQEQQNIQIPNELKQIMLSQQQVSSMRELYMFIHGEQISLQSFKQDIDQSFGNNGQVDYLLSLLNKIHETSLLQDGGKKFVSLEDIQNLYRTVQELSISVPQLESLKNLANYVKDMIGVVNGQN